MTKDLKQQLIKRLYSLLWRVGCYAVVTALGIIVNSLGLLNLSSQEVALISLILGEVTKYINTYALSK